jgi:hypothetical protein
MVTPRTVVLVGGRMAAVLAAETLRGEGVEADARCVTSAPDVYGAGDVARRPGPVLGGDARRLRRGSLVLGPISSPPTSRSPDSRARGRVVVRGGLDDARLTAYYVAGAALVVLGHQVGDSRRARSECRWWIPTG